MGRRPIFTRPEPPDTPDQRAKNELKGRIRAAAESGDQAEVDRLTAELLELRTNFYRQQQQGDVTNG